MTCTEEQVRNDLKSILDRVEAGEEVTIVRDGEPVARLTGTPRRAKAIPFDSMKNDIEWVDGWEKPMTDQEVKEFFGK